MDINATLIGQIITFTIFVWVTMKFVWPPLMKIMDERRDKIADGLAAAEQGKKELELARIKVQQELTEAKAQASHIIEQANRRANNIIEESKGQARDEGNRLLEIAKGEIEQEYNIAKQELLSTVSKIAIAGAERILQREVDQKSNDRLVNELAGEI